MPLWVTRIAAALLGLLLACSALAQPAGETRPRFLIDSIRVVGLRYASERVIVAETRLRPGREYAEAELHAGAARAARLPFVVRIDLRLEKGQTRGAYELLIDVVEAKPVFAGAVWDAGGNRRNDERSASVGGRLFLGRSGVAHAAATAGNDDSFEIGYTQYDLFGSGVFVAALFEYRKLTYRGGALPPPDFLEPPSIQEQITTQLVAGAPLGGNHALRASWTREPTILRGMAGMFPGRVFSVQHITTGELSYLYDSTDDPLFPERGASVVGSVAMRRGPYVSLHPTSRPELTYYERPSFGIEARKHWQIVPRHSVWAGGEARHIERDAEEFTVIGRLEQRTATLEDTQVELGYALTLWDDERARRFGDVRLEAGAAYTTMRQVVQRGFGRDALRTSESGPTAFVGLVYRSPWAVVRLRFEAGE